MGGVREGLDRYPYLKHLIQLCPGDWVKQMVKINGMVGMKNRLMMYGGKKRFVCPFTSQEFWKCISFILSAVTYGKKVYKLWSEIPRNCKKSPTKLQRDVFGTTDLNKVCCDICHTYYCYACH